VAKTAMDRPVQVSVLDRLTDTPLRPSDLAAMGQGDARAAQAAVTMRGASMDALRDSLRRDLEWLLNTRRTPATAPEGLAELARSVYHYGLPDMTTLNRESPADRELLLRYVEETIALFEPRLTGVRVTVLGAVREKDEDQRQVRFLIEGMLRVDPAPERVAFDTVLEPAGGGYQVREAFGA